ncbi:MAG: hypothetical protein R3F23_08710, partial [Verrucomicrobiia bacterium]
CGQVISVFSEKEGFFGGEAKLTFKYKDQPEQTFLFSIRGKNPEDDLCKAYIIDQTPDDMDWFTYAIAKSESKDYGGQPYYNQFLANGGKYSPVPGQEGIPLHGKDSDTTPGGFGLFQVTVKEPLIPRGQIWNWQENVKGGIEIIKSKVPEAKAWLQNQKQQALDEIGTNSVPSIQMPRNQMDAPPYTIRLNTDGGIPANPKHTFTDSDILGGIIIKMYNGAAPIAPGHTTGTGHFCVWYNQDGVWEFRRKASNSGVTYVDRVAKEME